MDLFDKIIDKLKKGNQPIISTTIEQNKKIKQETEGLKTISEGLNRTTYSFKNDDDDE